MGHDRRPDPPEQHGGDTERDADPGEHHHQSDVPTTADRVDVCDPEERALQTDRGHDRQSAAQPA